MNTTKKIISALCLFFTGTAFAQNASNYTHSFGIGYAFSNYKNNALNGIQISLHKNVKSFNLGIVVKGYSKSNFSNENPIAQTNVKLNIVEAAFSASKNIFTAQKFNCALGLLNGICLSRLSDNNNNSLKWYGTTPAYASKTLLENQNYFVSPSLSFQYQINKKLSIENAYQYRFVAGNTQLGNPSDLNAFSVVLGIKGGF